MITPTAYAHATFYSNEGAALILTNVATGESHTVNGTTVEAWKGKKGITVRGYDERTGKYTGTLRHLSTDHFKFVGVIVRGYFIAGENYVMGYNNVKEVFDQNV